MTLAGAVLIRLAARNNIPPHGI